MEKKLTDQQIKGIDLSMKALRKVFPFIKEWKLIKSWANYQTHIYIDVYIDYKVLSKVLNIDTSEYFKDRIRRGEEVTTGALLSPFDWGEPFSDEYDKNSETSYNFGRKIKEALTQSYDFIPEEMKTFWTLNKNEYQCVLSIDNFIYKS